MNERFTVDRFDLLDDGYPCGVVEACNLLNQFNYENNYLKNRLKEYQRELYCKDRKLDELGISVECCDKNEKD